MINWRNDTPPFCQVLLVAVLDRTGDTPYRFITSAWAIQGKYDIMWITDNDILCGDVVAWAEQPEYPIEMEAAWKTQFYS